MSIQSEAQSQSKEPKYSRFTQQELPTWSPVLTPIMVLIIYFSIGVAFVGIGVGCLVLTTGVVEVSQRYDECISGENNAQRAAELYKFQGEGVSCTLYINVTDDMQPPIYVYYELNNFYQNHRRYVKSRSYGQLRGDSSPNDLDDCDPQQYYNQSKDEIIKPCGLVAWTNFNDTYQFLVDGVELQVDASNIAWDTDVKHLYADEPAENFNLPNELRGGATVNTTMKEDERFIVWMRNAALPSFRKLWGEIGEKIAAGSTIKVELVNRYNTYLFDGEKRVVLSTTSSIGGKNYFLGAMYVGAGVISIFCGTVYLVLYWLFPRKLGDIRKLSWNKSSPEEFDE
eukprot:TRINITY_DN9313_c0_g1_i7.p1 TRINITY_DN9313_c0_g1~~TRINITY_DN9313_c0_g1_i7.p1  ORF type:complete len:341 (-),score=34.48 TRINITY_DN9313_c0_g1_i7:166-1188(-)